MCIICRGEDLTGIKELNISGCEVVTEIPKIDGLQKLNCSYCISLTNIPKIDSLRILNCYYCDLLTTIPKMDSLQELHCYYCSSLTKIPKIDDLYYYYDWNICEMDYDTAIVTLSKIGCQWLKPSEEKLNKVITLQKYFKRYLLSNNLMNIISEISKAYYMPDNKGFYLCQREFGN